MIEADRFLDAVHRRGYRFAAGVPCSLLGPILNRVTGQDRFAYVGASSEGEAAAIAAGAWLAGGKAMVLCQNSGLGNMVNPLTSLHHTFRIPALLIVTWRGQPGIHDAPQHELMGEITHLLLGGMRIAHRPFPADEDHIEPALDAAGEAIDGYRRPFALVMAGGDVRKEPCVPVLPPPFRRGTVTDLRTGSGLVKRSEVLERFQSLVPAESAVIASTGKCGRELFTLEDRDQQLYQVGSLGCASAIGLGIALNSSRPVTVLDGDGGLLMKMGNLATIGSYRPGKLVHVVLDNGAHDSTGGQPTVAGSLDLAGVAASCGYATAADCDGLDGFESAYRDALGSEGPHFIRVRIARGSMSDLGRPSVPPHEIAARLRSFLEN